MGSWRLRNKKVDKLTEIQDSSPSSVRFHRYKIVDIVRGVFCGNAVIGGWGHGPTTFRVFHVSSVRSETFEELVGRNDSKLPLVAVRQSVLEGKSPRDDKRTYMAGNSKFLLIIASKIVQSNNKKIKTFLINLIPSHTVRNLGSNKLNCTEKILVLQKLLGKRSFKWGF